MLTLKLSIVSSKRSWWNGNYSRKSINISTYSFTRNDIELLQGILVKKFGVTSNFRTDRDKGYRMMFRTQETIKLINIIHPYIIPSMMYKVGLVTP